jgi:type VI secretion system protein ImpF
MSRLRPTDRLLPSLLDRLIELRDDERSMPGNPDGQSLSELQAAVCRDLQALFNTRQVSPDLAQGDDETSELTRSSLTYGLPELDSLNPQVPDQLKILQNAIEDAIRRFEPRLKDVRVKSIASQGPASRGWKMTVEALLRVDPTPVLMAFDTLIDPGSGKWRVQQQGGGK